jgi:hypothetical protein
VGLWRGEESSCNATYRLLPALVGALVSWTLPSGYLATLHPLWSGSLQPPPCSVEEQQEGWCGGEGRVQSPDVCNRVHGTPPIQPAPCPHPRSRPSTTTLSTQPRSPPHHHHPPHTRTLTHPLSLSPPPLRPHVPRRHGASSSAHSWTSSSTPPTSCQHPLLPQQRLYSSLKR